MQVELEARRKKKEEEKAYWRQRKAHFFALRVFFVLTLQACERKRRALRTKPANAKAKN